MPTIVKRVSNTCVQSTRWRATPNAHRRRDQTVKISEKREERTRQGWLIFTAVNWLSIIALQTSVLAVDGNCRRAYPISAAEWTSQLASSSERRRGHQHCAGGYSLCGRLHNPKRREITIFRTSRLSHRRSCRLLFVLLRDPWWAILINPFIGADTIGHAGGNNSLEVERTLEL
jgi:hypothetical protein